MGGIYKITNIINNKIYVGSTVSKFNRRWNCHKSTLRRNIHKNKYLQRAWNKYGESNFIFEIVEDIQIPTRVILIEREIFYKNKLGAEYNIAPIDRPLGIINVGRKHTEETKKRMKESHKNTKMPDWFGPYLSKLRCGSGNPMYGKKHTNETKRKLSESKKGIPKPVRTEEHRKNLSISHIGLNRGEKNKMFSGRYRFFHDEYGEEILGQCELIRKYGLKQSKIPLICNGVRKSYMGWKCLGKII